MPPRVSILEVRQEPQIRETIVSELRDPAQGAAMVRRPALPQASLASKS